MNKAQRKRVWKIFWRNKWEEIQIPFFVILGLIIFGTLVYFAIRYDIVALVLSSILAGTLLFGLLCGIQDWLKSNWKKAKRQAGVR